MRQRNILLVAMVAGALALAGCATPSTGLDPGSVATVRLNAGKALTLAYNGLDGATIAVEQAVKLGKLKGEAEQKAGQDLFKARSILNAAYTAYHNSGTDPSADIAAVADLLSTIIATTK